MAMSEECPMMGLPPDRRKLHVDKRIGIDVVIAFLGLLFTMFIYAMSQAQWKGETNSKVEALQQTDVRLDSDQKHTRDELNAKLDKLNEKQDQILLILGAKSPNKRNENQ